MRLSEIINQWNALIRVFDEGEETRLFSDIYEYNQRIQRALDLDESQITAVMILRNVLGDYLENKTLSLKEIVAHQQSTLRFLRQYADLMGMLEHPEIEAEIAAFQSALLHAVRQAGFHRAEVEAFLQDRYALAEIRLSALRAFKELKIDQFSKGPASQKGGFAFADTIYEFYDLNMLLRLMRQPTMPDGILLALIRDASDDRFSYFAFVAKNGGNLYLIHDRPDLPQPNYKRTGRGAAIERRFSDRVNANWFPYELLNVKWDEEKARYVMQPDLYARAIRAFDPVWNMIGKLSETEPPVLVWTFMLFGLFKERFFGEHPYQAEELSHTAMMIEFPENAENARALVAADTPSLVQYRPLELPRLTLEEVSNANPEVAALWKNRPTGFNQWMEDRYQGQISNADALLHPLVAPGASYVIHRGKEIIPKTESEKRYLWFERATANLHDLGALEMSEFGTREEIRKNLLFFARLNKARAIQGLADAEFEARKDEIYAWYCDRVGANMDALREAIARGKLMVKIWVQKEHFAVGPLIQREANILLLRSVNAHVNWHGTLKFHGGIEKGNYRCFFNRKQASYVAWFRVNDAEAAAALCGCRLEELPIFLQHYYKTTPYIGNTILDRVDPMEALRNPWRTLNLDVMVLLSKSGYKSLCKEFGQSPLEIAEKKPPEN